MVVFGKNAFAIHKHPRVASPAGEHKEDEMKEILGWWFSKDRKLPHGDGRAVVIGEWMSVDPPIVPCEHGLHLSVRAIDALQCAPGSLCYRVEGRGEIVEHNGDKHACSERRALWVIDAEGVLRRFARACALDVLHLWDAPDVVVRYLTTGDESLRAAAWAAARAAAWNAARGAQNTRLEQMLTDYHDGRLDLASPMPIPEATP